MSFMLVNERKNYENLSDKLREDGPFAVENQQLSKYKMFQIKSLWSMTELAKYIVFLNLNCKQIEGKPHWKLWSNYKSMSQTIKSRNFRQCKSYHQKMLLEHKTIQNIITFLKTNNSKLENLVNQQMQALQLTKKKKIKLQQKEQNNKKSSTAYQIDIVPTGHTYISEKQSNQSKKALTIDIENFQTFPPSLQNKENAKKEQWRECHQLFIEWLTRLKSLMLIYPYH